ncbi:MAG TPA: acyl-ACP thioesterase domain-containing protein [Acidimicrobiales bacterium]
MLDEPLVPLPPSGRVYRAGRRVCLGDASPSQRLRLDAAARYLQDVGNDDTADSGFDAAVGTVAGGFWVVRRAVIDVLAAPRWGEWIDLATWCSGIGGRWAERRLTMTSDGGGRIEVDTLWVHLDPETLAPARLPDVFMGLYGEAAQGRRASARRWLVPPPSETSGMERVGWPLRTVDFDVNGHVNNAAYWAAVEEILADHRDHPAHHSHGRPTRSVMEFGGGIEPDSTVELLVSLEEKHVDIWFTVDATVMATVRVLTLG